MKIINQEAVYMPHDIHPYNFIEKCARTCYKSEDKITDDSAIKMVKVLAMAKHLTTLEHEYLYFDLVDYTHIDFIKDTHPMFLRYINIGHKYISGSFRAFMELFENDTSIITLEMESILHNTYPEIFTRSVPSKNIGIKLVTRNKVVNDPEEYHTIRLIPHTVKFTTSRAIANELVRHRANITFSQESQRYVDYGTDKNNRQITVIYPLIDPDTNAYNDWHYAMLMAETQYMNLRKAGIKPEIARGVLPNDCKTEIVVTATEQEWQHIINLRYHGTTGSPHPQMKELMGLIYPKIVKETNGRVQ